MDWLTWTLKGSTVGEGAAQFSVEKDQENQKADSKTGNCS